MPLRVIEIDRSDNFYSIRHRLLFSGRDRAVLVLPNGDAPVGVVDLALLRRLADRERLDVGLVTGDRQLARDARALGLPAFSSLLLAEYYRPGWWRAGRRPERLGFAAGESVRAPIAAPLPASIWRRALLVLIVAVLMIGVLAACFLPAATITLRTRALPVQAIFTLTADPAATVASDRVIPARPLAADRQWEASGPTTADDEADRQRIAAQAMQSLGAAAPGILSARLDRGEWLIPSSVSVESPAQSFITAGDSATLQMDAVVTGLAVQEADLRPIILAELSNALSSDYAPNPAGIQVQLETFTGAESGQFQVTATTVGHPTIDTLMLVEQLRGRQASDAARLLASLPLVESPTIDVRPAWWWGWTRGRLPLRPERIRIEVVP